jgi:hypothetical protein
MTEYKPEDYINYRIVLAQDTIEEVKTHIENKFWNTAINCIMLVFMPSEHCY